MWLALSFRQFQGVSSVLLTEVAAWAQLVGRVRGTES